MKKTHQNKNMKKLYVFWHQFLINDWRRIVEFQFSKLVTSGLYANCEKITCGVVCGPENVEKHKILISNLMYINDADPKKIEFHYTHENAFEYITLKMLQDFSKNNDAYVLYFHTKGVSCPDKFGRLKVKKEKKRTHMEDINIIKWRECIAKLNEGNMCCGTNKRRKFFVGNFWWAKTEYINTLPELHKITLKRKRAY